jgi:tetratricopeptide (TPR) repeat protein
MSEGTEVLPAVICSPADQLRFERLWDRTIGTGFKVVIWEVPEPSARSQVLKWLEPRVNHRSARLIPVDLVDLLGREDSTLPQTFNIWRELTARVPPTSVSDHNAILVLTGFEELMYQPNVDRSVLLQQFNIQRDSLVRDFPCWWILLIHPASRQVWKTVAPDFCDFVALWIEAGATLSQRDANSQQSVESEKSQSDAFEPGGSMPGWYKQLKSAEAAILSGQFDSALDQITGFEVQIDPKRGEREMAKASLLKGDIFLNRGDSERALQLWRDKVLPVFRRLESLDEESQTLDRIASVVQTQGNLPEAQRLFGESLRISQRLADSDPANAAWQRDLSMSFDRLGALATAQGNLPEAQQLFGESLRIRQRLAESDRANAEWQRDLWVSYWLLANVTEQQDLPEAADYWQKALMTMDRMVAAGLFVSEQDLRVLSSLRAKIQS